MISKCVSFCHRYILHTWYNVLNTWGIWMGRTSCVTHNRWICTHNVYIIKIHVCIFILCFFSSHIHCFHEFIVLVMVQCLVVHLQNMLCKPLSNIILNGRTMINSVCFLVAISTLYKRCWFWNLFTNWIFWRSCCCSIVIAL